MSMIEDIAYLNRGKKKRLILEHLTKPKTPTSLGKLLHMHRASISQMLLDMEKQGFVICLNPKDKRGRFYQATKKGLKALEELKEIEE